MGKLTDDIRDLQVKIDEYGSRNERLLLENCELKLDIAWLQSKLRTQSELMSPNLLPSAKVHPTESTSDEDDLQTAQLKIEIFGFTRKNPSFGKVKSNGQQFLCFPS